MYIYIDVLFIFQKLYEIHKNVAILIEYHQSKKQSAEFENKNLEVNMSLIKRS